MKAADEINTAEVVSARNAFKQMELRKEEERKINRPVCHVKTAKELMDMRRQKTYGENQEEVKSIPLAMSSYASDKYRHFCNVRSFALLFLPSYFYLGQIRLEKATQYPPRLNCIDDRTSSTFCSEETYSPA